MSRWRKRKPSSPGKLRTFGADQLVPDECREPWQHLRLVRRERLHGAAVEELALDRAPLEHRALLRLELVEPRGQKRPQRRRHVDLAVVGREREHLGDEERVPARPVGDPPAQHPPAASLRSARPPRRRASGSSLSGTGQEGRRSSSSGRTMHSSSSGAPVDRSPIDSTRSRNVSSPHWRSSKQTTSGACSSSSLRNAQAISSALVGRSLSPKSDNTAAAASSSEGSASSCFTTSTTGQ